MKRLNFLIIFSVFVSLLTVLVVQQYVGETYVYIFFSIISTILIALGFRKNAIFFDSFIGVFLWFGFWFKTTINIILFDGKFALSVGNFDGSALEFDKALIIVSIGFIALITASILREKFIFVYPKNEEEKSSLFYFYTQYRKAILFSYVLLFLSVAITNFHFSIYQRGGISPEGIPFIVSGIYKWLLLFGLSSFGALIIKFELSLKQKFVFFVPILTLIESAITNASLLSRGMVINSSAIGFGMILFMKRSKIYTNKKQWIILISSFIIIFLVAISFAESLRTQIIKNEKNKQVSISTTLNSAMMFELENTTLRLTHWLVNRPLGMEGLLAIASSPKSGWDLFSEALSEKYDEHKVGFYDNFIEPTKVAHKNMHINTFPGFLGFFYYPGSILFLFCSLFTIGILASLIELSAYKLGKNNQILAALIAQVIAYRLANFGYVPAQSYLLFGSIFLNLFIIYGVDKIFYLWYKYKPTYVTT